MVTPLNRRDACAEGLEEAGGASREKVTQIWRKRAYDALRAHGMYEAPSEL
jgi:hypothetical protein